MEPGSMRQFILAFVLICFSAFFSTAETALISLSKLKLRSMFDENSKGAKDVEKVIKNKDKLLSSILIGNNLVNIALSSLATSFAMSKAGNNGMVVGITTAVVTLVILVFGEITPKTFALKFTEKVAFAVAKPIHFFMLLFTPIVFVLNKITGFIITLFGGASDKKNTITESELKTMLNVSHEEGVIEIDERQMINNVFEFGDSHAKDVMTPRTDMIALSVEATYSEAMAVFKEEQFSRVPVYREDTDHIIGVLHFKDFVFSNSDDKNFRIEKYMREPFFSYENKYTRELFAQMRNMSSPLAVILDEYGGTSGIVTIEDLVEEIVGEIFDEYDEEDDEIECVREHEYIVDGAAKIDDFNEMTGTNLISEDYDSIGGYVMGLAGIIPKQGTSVTDNGVTFIVEEVEKNRIERLRIILEVKEPEKAV